MEKRIEDYIEYDETSSTCLRWKKSPHPTCKVGEECFTSMRKDKKGRTGYYVGGFNYKSYYGHQVVWYLHHKEWSTKKYPINHKDGNGLNNKIENLERIPCNENHLHLNRKLDVRNKTGYRGVSLESTGRYSVVFKHIYRGSRDTLEEGIELWDKCYELDKQGIDYKDLTRPGKSNPSKVRGVKLSKSGKFYIVNYKSIYRGSKKTLEEGIELWNKCYELDKQGIVYKEVNKPRSSK